MTLVEEAVVAAAPLRSVVLRRLGGPDEDWAELQAFLDERDDDLALLAWFGEDMLRRRSRPALRALLDRDLAEIDELLSGAANAILHHPRFQALEASWRGAAWLTASLSADGMTSLKILDCRWGELARDLERALEFDQSALFELLYNQEFGMPGGVPYSLMVGLYELQHRPSAGHPTDDVTVLRHISRVAAAAFTPFVMGVAPAMFGIDHFGELDLRQSLAATFNQAEYRRLQAFQRAPEARFIGLVAPNILMRTPHRGRSPGDCGFRFEEQRAGEDSRLWANAALAVAQVCLRAFNEHRWLAAIRGTVNDTLGAGVVAELPVEDFETDSAFTALRFSLQVNASASVEHDMVNAGFICLQRCKDTPYLALYSLPSLHKPRGGYLSEIARVNEQLGAMLNYILCVSRFAHYIKVIGRDWIGSYIDADDCERRLQQWLSGFCSGGESLSYETRARYPLQDGRVSVREVVGQPGVMECTVFLKPHFQLDQAVSEFQLVTTLQGVQTRL